MVRVPMRRLLDPERSSCCEVQIDTFGERECPRILRQSRPDIRSVVRLFDPNGCHLPMVESANRASLGQRSSYSEFPYRQSSPRKAWPRLENHAPVRSSSTLP